MQEQSFKIETAWGDKLIPTVRTTNGRTDYSPKDLEGKLVYNKSQDVTGIFRAAGSHTSRGGHGEGDWTTNDYVIVTGKYELKWVRDGNILILKNGKI